jgi:hypothetical protein
VLGTGSVLTAKFENPFRHECSNWDEAARNRPHFNFEELKKIAGKRIRATKNTGYPDNIGRVSFPILVAEDKYMFIIHWERHPLNGADRNDLFDKERFEEFGVETFD